MHKGNVLILLLCFLFGSVFCQFNIDTIFKSNALLNKISLSPSKYHLQVIYTQIKYVNDKPVFKDFFYNTNLQNYFYCASLVKLPVSILALQKLNELNIPANAIFYTDSSIACHKTVRRDTSSSNAFPSIEHYIKKMFLVSDNEAYSRVYEFLGVDYMHLQLSKMGYPNIRIINRYDGNCTSKENYITNPVTFLDTNFKPLYHQNEQSSIKPYSHPLKTVVAGKAYYNSRNKKINAPKNFSDMNYFSLSDCHAMLKELIYNSENKFKISNSQRAFLINYLSYFPRQSLNPRYNSKTYYDSYKKYLFYGDSKNTITDTNIIITNIVGQSYGFMSDCARILDKKNNIEFMLSAVIYANKDEIINDGKYDYKTIALPYLAELGRQFYTYELKQKQK